MMIVFLSVAFAVCAALVAMALSSLKSVFAAVAFFVVAAIGFFAWRHARGNDQPSFWPIVSVWIVTTLMMLSVLLGGQP